MKYYFDQIKNKAEEEVKTVNDRVLNGETYKNNLFKKHKIIIPYLEKDSTNTVIEKEKLRMNTAPPGFSFTPGKEYEYVHFSVPIKGDLSFLKEVLKGYRFDRFFQLGYDKIEYKVFSSTQISDNDKEIDRIKNIAKEKFESIENTLSQHKESVENFNQDLDNFLDDVIQSEIEKRDKKSGSESKLNPFS